MPGKKKIILTGGGTLGSVVPLIAVYQELLKKGFPKENFLWVGTIKGPEQKFIEDHNIKFESINSGKFRRYFAWQNFFDFFYFIIGFIEAIGIIIRFKPDLVISAGSFVSVPLVWAARMFGKKITIHQQDIRPGLANKIMSAAADKITVTFEKSTNDFDKDKVVWLGNPVREEIKIIKGKELRIENYKEFNLDKDKPVLLILGGGTGAMSLNRVITESSPKLLEFCQVLHLTGRNKNLMEKKEMPEGYQAFEFLDNDLPLALKIADLVISRAGMSALTELSYLAKPTIIIPIPDSHQEDNAEYFSDRQAVIYLKQNDLTEKKLIDTVNELLNSKEKREQLGNNFKNLLKQGADEKFVKIIENLLNTDNHGKCTDNH